MKQVYLESYGCQMNLADSELVMGVLAKAGYFPSDSPQSADVILVNTCAVREHAEEKVLGRIAELNRFKLKKPELVLGVLGCMAKHLGKVIAERAPYVDLVVSPDGYRRLPELIGQSGDKPYLDLRLDRTELYEEIDPVRKEGVNAWVTIMRGCDKFCTFCIVPYVRGRERCVPPDEILRQVRNLAEEGYKEVTFLGQTVNAYRYNGTDFADLLHLVSGVEGIERIRFTSPHPSDFSEKDIETIANLKKVCNHLHLPVQSGSDKVLKRMRRTYTSGEYLDLVGLIRDKIPDVGLTTDIIVGFCGETEEDFQATLALVRKVRYDSAFMFKYSPRSQTVAYRKFEDDVPEKEKGRRLEELIHIQESISREVNQTWIGKRVEVLVEGESKKDMSQFYGKTDNFKTVVFPRNGEKPGDLVEVEVVNSTSHTLLGRRV
ncbi:tRNA (N6-isopentenyl adenosine(37)-C2)-methylthiotransferase MiaB [candidate division TA06 bacterium]|nr:tRNA (N6-isopentenyl adenosine(37)-C2)-methylthiotransferase MiaB [candidate division TA06 bacterium]